MIIGKLTIGGHEIEIELLDSIIDENDNLVFGLWREREGKILLSKQAGALMSETLIHEIMHAIDRIYNNGKLDEDTIDALSQGWYQVLKGGDVFRVLKEQPEQPARRERMIEIEIECYGKKHKAYVVNGVIQSECSLCNGMLSGDCEAGD